MNFQAVLFDCDGVLVHSESITNGVLRDMLEESGWTLTPADCMRIFIGKAVKDERLLEFVFPVACADVAPTMRTH